MHAREIYLHDHTAYIHFTWSKTLTPFLICSNIWGYKQCSLCQVVKVFNIVLNIFPFAFLLRIRELSRLMIFYTHSYLYPKRIMIRMVCLEELWLHVEKWHNTCCWISWWDPLRFIRCASSRSRAHQVENMLFKIIIILQLIMLGPNLHTEFIKIVSMSLVLNRYQYSIYIIMYIWSYSFIFV